VSVIPARPARSAREGELPEPSSLPQLLASLGLFLVLFLLLVAFHLAMPVLWDTDSYCHLALGKIYQRHGIVKDLPWARYSLMRDGFGDKEFLFHLALGPFAGEESSTGGRVAAALLGAGVLALVGHLAAGAVGRWGLLLPFFLLVTALDVPDRLIRLRPELAGLLLFLLATAAAARGRYRWLGVWSFLLVLAYNVFHLLLALALAWTAIRWWRRRELAWPCLLYPLLGVGAGLLLHPHFPKNLEIWSLVTVEQLGELAQYPDGGRDVLPASTVDLLRNNFAWWLGLGVLWLGRRRTNEPEPVPAGVEAGCFTMTALAFAFLYFGAMWRFGVYFYPFASLAVLYEARQRGVRFTGGIPVWNSPARRLPVGVALAGCVLLALPGAVPMARFFLDRSAPGPTREDDWRELARHLPDGARVAAPWGLTGAYLFWAPQARYLNILDPIFMARADLGAYRTQLALFSGEHPDPPLAVGEQLTSDYLAVSRFAAPARLRARLAGDPRFEPVYSGYSLLYRIRPEANTSFWLDWTVQPGSAQGVSRPYPRMVSETGRALEGFVDAARVSVTTECVTFVRRVEPGAAIGALDLAAYGPVRLRIDGELLFTSRSAPGAILSQASGLVLPRPLAGGEEVTVESCPDLETGRNGFYLRPHPEEKG
jgi:hypothetical protein